MFSSVLFLDEVCGLFVPPYGVITSIKICAFTLPLVVIVQSWACFPPFTGFSSLGGAWNTIKLRHFHVIDMCVSEKKKTAKVLYNILDHCSKGFVLRCTMSWDTYVSRHPNV